LAPASLISSVQVEPARTHRWSGSRPESAPLRQAQGGCIEELKSASKSSGGTKGQVQPESSRRIKAGRKAHGTQGQGRPDRPAPKAKKLERKVPHNPNPAADPTTNFWRRPIRSALADGLGPRVSRGPWPRRPIRSALAERPRQPTYAGEGECGYLFRDVPAERRSSQASTTRFAMPASANFPQARGSYAFLLPTSPSTFSTPS
jgi:hypothetical protein